MNPYYGTASAPVRTEQIILSDGNGEFAMDRDSTVTVLSGYPNVGQVFYPGTGQHGQVVANLAAVANNRQRIKDFTGVAPAAPSAGTSVAVVPMPEGMVPLNAIPLWRRSWFLPTVAGVATVAVIGGVIIYKARKKKSAVAAF